MKKDNKGHFKPGDERINRNGRPSVSLKQKEIKVQVGELVTRLLTDLLDNNELDELTPRNKANLLSSLLEYSIPKLQRKIEFVDIGKLSEEDVDSLLDNLVSRIDQ